MPSWIAYPFWNPGERRLRALVRILLHGLLAGALSFGVAWTIARIVRAVGDRLVASVSEGPLFLLIALAFLLATWFACRFFDRRPLAGVGLRVNRAFAIDLAAGFAIGALLMGGICGAELTFGWARFHEAAGTGAPRLALVGVALLAFLGIGFYEELSSRGYHVTNLAEGLRCRWISAPQAALWAAVISSLAFGIAHAGNPNATIASTGNIVGAGMMLAVGYLTTGRLALSIGLHWSWNFFQNLFGMPVSGQTRFFFGAVLARDARGPAWVTGGTFGPEAGATGLVAMLAGMLLVLAYVRLRYGPLRIDPRIASLPPSVRDGAQVTPEGAA